jgi:hypothetical protein
MAVAPKFIPAPLHDELPETDEYLTHYQEKILMNQTSRSPLSEAEELEITNFREEVNQRGRQILSESVAPVDQKGMLMGLLEKANLVNASSEILRLATLSKLVPMHSNPQKREKLITFLVSLDFLVKGTTTHSQIKHLDSPETSKKAALMKDIDIKYPILIGDQFNSKAYYLTSRLGDEGLTQALSSIEENF